MNLRRVRALVRKEWQETLRNPMLVLTFAVLLAVFGILPAALALAAEPLAASRANTSSLAPLQKGLAVRYPGFARMAAASQLRVVLYRQFHVFFLVLPVVGAMSIATYSLIGEKTARSLEPLLATPLTTKELLFAKSVAAAAPATAATWAVALLHAGAARAICGAEAFAMAFDAPSFWLLALVTPLVGFLGLLVGVAASSRATDPRAAQQVGALLVLPVVAVFAGQAGGLFLLSVPLVLAGALAVAVLDAVALGMAIALFDRERMLTRWR